MMISDEELQKRLHLMERGTINTKDGRVLCVCTLKNGDETTNYFSLREIILALSNRKTDKEREARP